MILKELFVALGMKTDEASFAKGALAAEGVKAVLEKVVDIAKETVEGFAEMVKATAEYGKETIEAAQATGLTTTALQQLRGAARASGLETEDLDTGLFRLSRTMFAVKKGGEEQSAVFAKLGVRATDAHGKLRGTDEVLSDLAASFERMPDGAEKTALAMEIFGRSGARLIPMLNKGKQGIDELRASAVVMSREQLEAGEEVVKTQRQLANLSTKLWRGAIAPLLPSINELLKRYLAWRKANAEIMRQHIEKYVGGVISAVRALSNFFSFLVRNAAAVKAVVITGAIFGMINALELLSVVSIKAAWNSAKAWLVAAAPFVAIGAILAGLFLVFDDLRTYFEDLKQGSKEQHSLFGTFKKGLDEWMKPTPNEPWFLTALRDFVTLLHEAIKMLTELDILTGKWKPAVARGRTAGPQTEAEAGKAATQLKEEQARATDKALRDIFGDVLVDAFKWNPGGQKAKGAWDAALAPTDFAGGGGSSPGPVAPMSPTYSPPPIYYRPDTPTPLRSGPSTYAPQFTIIQQPGEDSEALVRKIDERIEEHWDGKMEDAAAAVGP